MIEGFYKEVMTHTKIPKPTPKNLQLTLLLLVTPIMVLANAGSPMMWFGLIHILLLNLIIGIIESRIINYLGVKNRIWLIILANYISMFVGMVVIAPYFASVFGNKDFWGAITSKGQYELDGFIIGMFISLIATMIIEFPFALISVKKKENRNALLKPFLIANLATNFAMFICYFLIVFQNSK